MRILTKNFKRVKEISVEKPQFQRNFLEIIANDKSESAFNLSRFLMGKSDADEYLGFWKMKIRQKRRRARQRKILKKRNKSTGCQVAQALYGGGDCIGSLEKA